MNQIVVSAKITRKSAQDIRIEFGRTGEGDDIVAQWADRLTAAMEFASKPPKAVTSATVPEGLQQVAKMLALAARQISRIAKSVPTPKEYPAASDRLLHYIEGVLEEGGSFESKDIERILKEQFGGA